MPGWAVPLRRPGRTALALLVLCLLGGLVSCADEPAEVPEPALVTEVLAHVEAVQGRDGGAYRVPEEAEADAVADAVLALLDGRPLEAERLLRPLDLAVRTLSDGRQVVEAQEVPDDRGWGLVAVRPGGREVVVEVPHPRADLGTERLGAEIAVRADAAVLLVAGARRERADGAADVARVAGSVFDAVHAALAARGLPALQLHGYADDSLPGHDAVVSPGAGQAGPLHDRVARALRRQGLDVCRPDGGPCERLSGRGNVQGAASARTGTPFVHLELGRSVREDEDGRGPLVEVLAGSVPR